MASPAALHHLLTPLLDRHSHARSTRLPAHLRPQLKAFTAAVHAACKDDLSARSLLALEASNHIKALHAPQLGEAPHRGPPSAFRPPPHPSSDAHLLQVHAGHGMARSPVPDAFPPRGHPPRRLGAYWPGEPPTGTPPRAAPVTGSPLARGQGARGEDGREGADVAAAVRARARAAAGEEVGRGGEGAGGPGRAAGEAGAIEAAIWRRVQGADRGAGGQGEPEEEGGEWTVEERGRRSEEGERQVIEGHFDSERVRALLETQFSRGCGLPCPLPLLPYS